MAIEVCSMVQGRVIEVLVAAGDRVHEGDELLIIESMKMELPIGAPESGRVESVLVGVGDAVGQGKPLVILS